MRRSVSKMCLVLVASLLLVCSGSGDKDKDTGIDAVATDTRKVVSEPFGSVCDNPNEACKAIDKFGYKLACVSLTGGTSGKGYCSRTCSDVDDNCYGVPNGQMAECFVEAAASDDSGPGTKYCGFFCKNSKGVFDCPPGLKCGKANANGNRVCLQ